MIAGLCLFRFSFGLLFLSYNYCYCYGHLSDLYDFTMYSYIERPGAKKWDLFVTTKISFLLLNHQNFCQDELKQLARSERMAIHVSNIANMVLFIAKVYASVESRSLAVIASTLDSFLDLLSGCILWFTSNAMKNPNHYHYPIGKQRMQPVVSCTV